MTKDQIFSKLWNENAELDEEKWTEMMGQWEEEGKNYD